MDDLVKSIETWFALAKPNPTERDVAVQIGCHFEEVYEMLEATNNAGDLSCYSSDSESNVGTLHDLASFYKDGFGNDDVADFDRTALLDALCDQIVTAIGVGQLMGFDMAGALSEVNRSNYSKFENGQPVFTEQGKIAKGKDYTPPELGQFLGVNNG